jgi:hypothetical protein
LKVNTAILDQWLLGKVIYPGVLESFCGNPDDVLLLDFGVTKLRLNCLLPFSLHDISHTGSAEAIPSASKPLLANALESLVYEDATTDTACSG